jgi:hypothetical protein
VVQHMAIPPQDHRQATVAQPPMRIGSPT